MLDFSNTLNLPLIWGAIILLAIAIYVILDGFDLGVGILFLFAPSEECKNKMINSIAPFWDGNETWLVLGGGVLFAAFPMAYAIISPAVYLPILFMLVALIFRGVAFEFRFKASAEYRKIWDMSFHYGSVFAAFMQGVILGSIVQGVSVDNSRFAGKAFDWLSAFSVVTGIALVMGYALLGATWIIMKSSATTQNWARRVASYLIVHVLFFMAIVCLWMPFIDDAIYARWFLWPNCLYVAVIPLVTIYVSSRLIHAIRANYEYEPFFMTIALFMLGFLGLLISLWPYIVPRSVTFTQAAASPKSLSIMLVGVTIALPVILLYTGYNYYVFRGKADAASMYK